ncbi:MAG: hypothetical protein JWP27_2706 [Flaviaesturariibacter sp.]|nr:hypothetical protein [Flaviaesturariibacter sp.]
MKWNKSLFLTFCLLILACSLYRVWDGRPFGFMPQIALAIFGGAVIKNKKYSFLVPLLSMFLSDAFYQVLYSNGLSKIPGFYEGQITNYLLFIALTVFGFFARSFRALPIAAVSIAAPTAYFLLSNFQVWIGGGGYGRTSLLACYADGLPFYGWSLLSTLLFSGVFFGTYLLSSRSEKQPVLG